MSRAAHLQAGAAAEDAALDYLRKQGLVLVERNFRCRYGELDLIMRDETTLVFVEVRFRRSDAFGGAFGSIDEAKQRKLTRAAECYLARQSQHVYDACRFDAVAVRPAGRGLHFDWLADAF